MAAKIIKELYGFSGNKIYLMNKHEKVFVRKIGNISRNIERLQALSNDFPLPELYTISKKMIDMEYLHGLDIKTYLKTSTYDNLTNFLLDTLIKLSSNSVDKDYTEIYKKKLNEVSFDEFSFTRLELIDKLPKVLPSSNYHGDLTLENIIYTSKGFYLIDCATIEYDSYIFDIAKLRQDLELGWFIRKESIALDIKLKHIQDIILSKYPLANNDYLLILMLIRIYRHTKPNTLERDFILKGIHNLWK